MEQATRQLENNVHYVLHKWIQRKITASIIF